jgi:signal transduction histidine kinase
VFYTNCLPLIYQPATEFADVASGLLALQVSNKPRDYLLWFRLELTSSASWSELNGAGEAVAVDEVLTPHASFAAWQQSARLHSSPWREMEVEAAQQLRLSLLEVVLQRIDQIAAERETARLKQEQLTQELSHRLEEWQNVARALQKETTRRTAAEADLSDVLRRIVTDQEAERLRIARELHDTLGQSLTVLKLGLDGIERAAPASADVQDRVARLKALTAETVKDMDRLAREIRPTALDDLGIQTAVENFLEAWSERSNVVFDLQLTLDERRLPPLVESTLFRVLQEALTNVVRHAEAKRVGVILGVSGNDVTMIIEDDGRGFGWDESEPGRHPARRLGLLGIRERMALVGGSLEVESAPGEGTTLFVRVPL